MIGLAALLLCGLGVALVGVCAWTAWTLTHPPRRTYATAVSHSRPGHPGELPSPRAFSTFEFRAEGGMLPAWDIRGDDASGPLLIMTHGWGDSRIGALSRMPAFLPLVSRIIAWDMRGHGDAPGTCALGAREPRDLGALMDHVAGEGPLVLFGWSLGAGVSIAAAAAEPDRVIGVIAEAPYRIPPTPARGVLKRRAMPWRVNLPVALTGIGLLSGAGVGWRGFDRAAWAAKLRCPLLVIHGVNDDVCPIEDGRAIAAAARRGRIVEIAGAGHAGLWTQPELLTQCGDTARSFLAELRAG